MLRQLLFVFVLTYFFCTGVRAQTVCKNEIGYQSSGSIDVYSMSMTVEEDDDDEDDDNDDQIVAFGGINAENYNSTTSSTIKIINNEASEAIGYITKGDTITFNNVNFGSGASAFTAYIASEVNSNVEVRIDSADGTLLATLSNLLTGSWDSYQNKTVILTEEVTGVHDLVLVFSGPVNVDIFRFLTANTDDTIVFDESAETIPGRIEAEDFSAMSGIGIEYCAEGGKNIGYIEIGDWVEYRVNVPKSGLYTISYHLASKLDYGSFDLLVNGTLKHNITVPNTDCWQSYQTQSRTIELSAGVQTLRLEATGNYWNLNWFELQMMTSGP